MSDIQYFWFNDPVGLELMDSSDSTSHGLPGTDYRCGPSYLEEKPHQLVHCLSVFPLPKAQAVST